MRPKSHFYPNNLHATILLYTHNMIFLVNLTLSERSKSEYKSVNELCTEICVVDFALGCRGWCNKSPQCLYRLTNFCLLGLISGGARKGDRKGGSRAHTHAS